MLKLSALIRVSPWRAYDDQGDLVKWDRASDGKKTSVRISTKALKQ